MVSENIGVSDSVVAVVTRASHYGLGSFLFDVMVIALLISIVYFGIKKVKRWKSEPILEKSPQLPRC